MLANQHPSGAFPASPDFSQYSRYCWLRDGSFVAYSLDRAGSYEAAERFHRWCLDAVEGIASSMDDALGRARLGKPFDPAAMPPARFGLDGQAVQDDWPNFQIDGYGTWLWALAEHIERSGAGALPGRFEAVVSRTASYLAVAGSSSCYDVWEENGGSVHTSTLACVYGGLVAASRMLGEQRFAERAARLREALLERARREGRFAKSSDDAQVDASLLWLAAPFGLAATEDPAFLRTAAEVSSELDLEGGIRRYPNDTYFGGGAWPVLTASLGWHLVKVGDLDGARRRLDWITGHIDREGRLGEQFGGERRDPAMYDEWVRRWGPVAADLVWSHAMLVVLAEELRAASPARGAREHAEAPSTGSGSKPASPDGTGPPAPRGQQEH
ncbi:MAG TPA: glycoside hydrolase family 15 protein, partial [Acidimicrobiales bacterium]|nr:glycoside hydrolase family 15 protein [Acidimicrobiales bacterium]